MSFTYNQLKDALQECTCFDLLPAIDSTDEPCWALIDGCGDMDGDYFYDLDDVADYITNDELVEKYLASLSPES